MSLPRNIQDIPFLKYPQQVVFFLICWFKKNFDSLAQRIGAFFRSCLSASNQRFGQLIAVDTDRVAVKSGRGIPIDLFRKGWKLMTCWGCLCFLFNAKTIHYTYKDVEVSHGFIGVGWVLWVEIRYEMKICFPKILPWEQPSSPIASGLQAFHPCLVRGWDSSSTTDVHATTDEQLEK